MKHLLCSNMTLNQLCKFMQLAMSWCIAASRVSQPQKTRGKSKRINDPPKRGRPPAYQCAGWNIGKCSKGARNGTERDRRKCATWQQCCLQMTKFQAPSKYTQGPTL